MSHQHIVPRREGWGVKRENAKRASRVFKDRSDALAHATALAKKNDSCMVLHGKTGKIQRFDCDPNVRSQHVIRDKGDWSVLSPGIEMAKKSFPNKGTALKYAYTTAKKHDVCMVVHSKGGDFKSIGCPPHYSSLSMFETFRMRYQL